MKIKNTTFLLSLLFAFQSNFYWISSRSSKQNYLPPVSKIDQGCFSATAGVSAVALCFALSHFCFKPCFKSSLLEGLRLVLVSGSAAGAGLGAFKGTDYLISSLNEARKEKSFNHYLLDDINLSTLQANFVSDDLFEKRLSLALKESLFTEVEAKEFLEKKILYFNESLAGLEKKLKQENFAGCLVSAQEKIKNIVELLQVEVLPILNRRLNLIKGPETELNDQGQGLMNLMSFVN